MRVYEDAEVVSFVQAHEALFDLISSLIDEGDCRFDHHGGCQEHGYLSLEAGEMCPQEEAKRLVSGSVGVSTHDLDYPHRQRSSVNMVNRFLGLDADEWEASDGLPYSPMAGRVLTVEDVKAGIVAMLRRLNDANEDA